MRHLQPFLIAVIAFFFIGFTAWHAQSDMLQSALSTAFLGEMPQEKKSLQLADNLQKAEAQAPKQVDSETLWLARVIYSETKQPHEQELIAWVVRNRVETNYRGNNTYREAVLDPYQFSAFNPGSRKRSHYSNLNNESRASGWRKAVEIAHQVKTQSESDRPFSVNTRHFYSERSMVGRHQPGWANGQRPKLSINRTHNVDERRFRFFEDVM